MYIYVGNKGASGAPGNYVAISSASYNGGGKGYGGGGQTVGNGGGATDIRYFGSTTPTTDDLNWNSVLGLNSRIMVAGGGGGKGSKNNAGVGGTLIGQKGYGGGGGQDAGGDGTFGIGGYFTYASSGGGGGYYGGGDGGYSNSGGGGSSFISGYAGVNAITTPGDNANPRTHSGNTKHYSNKYFIKGEMQSGTNTGNGKAKIIYVGDAPERTNTDLNNVRYIKDCINGSTLGTDNTWVELQAMKDGINLAKGKSVTGSVTAASGYAYTYITDGMIDNTTATSGYGKSSSTGNQCITVDLGSINNLDEIVVWHYFADEREYTSNLTSVSNDGTTWTLIMNESEQETSNGKRVNAWQSPLSGDDYYNYTGDYQVFTATESGYYKVEAWGAQGGENPNYLDYSSGGKGAYTYGLVYLNANEKLYIYVGSKGGYSKYGASGVISGGYNGGGAGVGSSGLSSGGGGGATDIRYFSSTPTSDDLVWNSTSGLNSRIMVAAGGGGASYVSTSIYGSGGSGGGLYGENGNFVGSGGAGGGASQTSIGSTASSNLKGGFGFGSGVSGNCGFGGGGGGGYYGGGTNCSWRNAASGGGGSSYISGYAGVNSVTSLSSSTHANTTMHYSGKYFINGEMLKNANIGNGRAKITYYGSSKPVRNNTNLNNVRYIKDCINGSNIDTSNEWVEFQAIKNGINLAKGKTATIDSGTISNVAYITDGLINTNTAKSSTTGNRCITIDLGSVNDLDEIAVWHNYANGRTYNDNITFVSSNNSTWTAVINNTNAESIDGKRTSAYEDVNVYTLRFKYTGSFKVDVDPDVYEDNSTYATEWYTVRSPYKIKFLSSGILTFDTTREIDAFIVGGGGVSAGCYLSQVGGGYAWSTFYGGGGYHTTFTTTVNANTQYNITVGAVSEATNAFGQNVNPGGNAYCNSYSEQFSHGTGGTACGEFESSGSTYSGDASTGANTGRRDSSGVVVIRDAR